MSIALKKPYTYELSSEKGLIISYTPKNSDGKPLLTIQHKGRDCIWIFKDKEIIQNEALELNLITVDLSKHLLGAPRKCLSLLLPAVYLIDTAPLKTYCIKTTTEAATSPESHIGSLNNIGQHNFYEIIDLTGTAKSKED